MSWHTRRWLAGISWFSAVFRFHGLFTNTFNPDEALFATWARYIAVWRDPLLITQAVDKPPLLFYLQALFYPLLGPVEWAARMPNLVVSLLLVPLTGLLAWKWWRDEKTAVFATLLTTLSPLAIQFTPTAFTDPLMTFLVVLSFEFRVSSSKFQVSGSLLALRPSLLTLRSSLLTLRSSPFASGLFLGLAVATKYQAVLFLPLLAGLAWLDGWTWREWKQWLMGFVGVVLLVVGWDVARTGTVSLLAAQVNNYGGTRLIWSWELWPRLWAWVGVWGYVLGWGWISAVFWGKNLPQRAQRVEKMVIFLAVFLAGYFLLHWLMAVPVWDRYALPVVPFIVILIGRGVARFNDLSQTFTPFAVKSASTRPIRVNPRAILPALLFILLLPGAVAARNGRFPIGSSPTSDAGASQIAVVLQDAPYGTVLYDHWFSWQWRYHLFDQKVYVSWFPHPAGLADELAVFGRDGNLHYLVLPDSAVSRPVLRAVEQAGFRLIEETRQGEMILYRIEP